MKTQFLREHHNRQEKAWKEPTGCVGGTEPPGLWSWIHTEDGVRLVLDRTLADRMDREESRYQLMQAFEAQVRRGWRCLVSGYKFMFTWNAAQFADANHLSLTNAKVVLANIRKEAEGRLHIVKQRVRRRGLKVDYERDEFGQCVEERSLSFPELVEFLPIDRTGK
jgi:hypothetical protein